MQEQAPDLVRSVVHAATAVHQDVAAWHTSTLQHVTNVKYALSRSLVQYRPTDDTDPLGCASDELADALNLAHDGHALQDELEGLVARNLLARQGIGHGALYTLPTPPTGHP